VRSWDIPQSKDEVHDLYRVKISWELSYVRGTDIHKLREFWWGTEGNRPIAKTELGG
jgi:hypothetical protein